jgi:hypothetical protein
MPAAIKVHFRLVQDGDGYPPVAVESIWAQPTVKAEEYVLDNVPFFAREATIGDVILVREQDGQHWFKDVVTRSMNSLVRIVFFDRTSTDRVNKDLIDLGCSTEYLKSHNLLAVSIPGTVDLGVIEDYLQKETSARTLDYEEPILRQ